MSNLLKSGQVGHLIWSKPFVINRKRKLLKVKEWLKENKLSGGAFHSIDTEKELTDMINELHIKSIEVGGKIRKTNSKEWKSLK